MLQRYLLGSSPSVVAGEDVGLVQSPSTFQRHVDTNPQAEDRDSLSALPSQQMHLHTDIMTRLHGTGAPRTSRAASLDPTNTSATAGLEVVEPPMPVPAIAILPDMKQLTLRDDDWQVMEIPSELAVYNDTIPRELKRIIHESFEEHRLLQLIRKRSTEERPFSPTISMTESPVNPLNLTLGKSLTASPCSDYQGRKDSIFSTSQDSYTTVESAMPDHPILHGTKAAKSGDINAPLTICEETTSNQSAATSPTLSQSTIASPVPGMRHIEHRFHLHGDRSSRTRGLYNLFKGCPARSPSTKAGTSARGLVDCFQCLACVESADAVKGLSCQHTYCKRCFDDLIDTQARDEELFPPKCCSIEIPKLVIRRNISSQRTKIWDQKALEYAVPFTERLYCPSQECRLWIDVRHAEQDSQTLKCPQCQLKLCIACRSAQHLELTCTANTSMSSFNVASAGAAIDRAAKLLQEAEGAEAAREGFDQAQHDYDLQDRLAEHHAELRAIIDHIGLEQKRALEQRQWREDEDHRADEPQQTRATIEQQTHAINAELTGLQASQASAIKQLQQKHASALMETFNRHRRDQDSVLNPPVERPMNVAPDFTRISPNLSDSTSLTRSQSTRPTLASPTPQKPTQPSRPLVPKEGRMEETPTQHRYTPPDPTETLTILLQLQQSERSTLQDQQARELAKWRIRHETAHARAQAETQLRVQRMAFALEENLARRTDALAHKHLAEAKISDWLHACRVRLLASLAAATPGKELERTIGYAPNTAPAVPIKEMGGTIGYAPNTAPAVPIKEMGGTIGYASLAPAMPVKESERTIGNAPNTAAAMPVKAVERGTVYELDAGAVDVRAELA